MLNTDYCPAKVFIIYNNLFTCVIVVKSNVPNPVDNYLFKVNNGNTRTRRETWSELTIKTPE